MTEFMTPRSFTGYKLQLLSPYGLLHKYNPKMEPIYKELGLPSAGHGILPEGYCKYLIPLVEDVVETLDAYYKREKQEKILMKILRPEDLQRLGNYLKNSEKVSPLE
ncbi:hypothetical protein PCASD_01393 [Puccinia coronata f. sp. avenae]|uniref:Uncharacterized protein n=1 Tax=Puccinia coronata f. sp. avenae TaxID=200324 RepID=A0A2N5VKS2_9BASI|nr:hypothetical protein PCASD_01393 [Puccinia coronata f. sp. avenae]